MEPFLGEIRLFAGNYAPRDWALCWGQIMPIAQYTALFSLLGVSYGGDGKTTFALPDLRASVPIGWGNGPGLTPRTLGEAGGEPTVTLTANEMPWHTHPVQCAAASASVSPENAYWGKLGRGNTPAYSDTLAQRAMLSPLAAGVAGGSQPHNNMQSFLGLTFIIALEGIFPQRP